MLLSKVKNILKDIVLKIEKKCSFFRQFHGIAKKMHLKLSIKCSLYKIKLKSRKCFSAVFFQRDQHNLGHT